MSADAATPSDAVDPATGADPSGTDPTRAARLSAGLALVLAPLLAVAVRFVAPGWLLIVVILYASIPLVIGYALQVVVAAHAFLRRRTPLRAAGVPRGIAAAWTTSAGALVVGLAAVDGGDSAIASPAQVLTGLAGVDAALVVSQAVAWLAAVAWIGGWVWLVVEWIVALAGRRR